MALGFGTLFHRRQKSSMVANSHSLAMLSSYDLEFLSGARCSHMTHSLSRKCGPAGTLAGAGLLSMAPFAGSPAGSTPLGLWPTVGKPEVGSTLRPLGLAML